ncbi:MAG: AglZ/HisF2 family acetamidino modification protein [Rickettsiales bacterium]
MARPRIIPCLLLRKTGLVKGEKFANHRYVGDAINTARIFNDKGVDELMLLDIDATREGREPNYALIGELASECFMPLCYGGGVKNVAQMERLYRLGCEKICITTAASTPGFIEEAAARFGRQSVVVGIDVRKKLLGGYEVMVASGSRKIATLLEEYVRDVTAKGAGEILIQAIHKDGTLSGYDLELVGLVAKNTTVPVIAAGGANSAANLAAATRAGASAASAGALFVFQGKHRAVLVNVPSRADMTAAFSG